MKLGLTPQSYSLAFLLPALCLGLANAGCSGSSPPGLIGLPGNDGGVIPPSSPPHALARIVLGEHHRSGGSSSSPLVSASFIPDVAGVSQCTTSIAGCSIATPAVCDGATGPLCQGGQTCSLDAACKPTCRATCSVQCPTGQECYFATASTQSCRPTQSFDAGSIVLSGPGLASGITLFPPAYTFSGSSGNPIVPGGQINVTASGATAAGFAPFTETFKATNLVQTVPALSTLTSSDVFNLQGLSLGWQPGSDAIVISVTGPKGTASCAARDAAGTFTVPPQVISTVAGPGTGSTSIEIAVSRERVEEKTDGKTQGTLIATTVQPIGYVDLATVSTETVTVQGNHGCPTGTASCNSTCVDLSTSASNCGTCGNSCGIGYCSGGICYGTTPTCTGVLTSCSGLCVNLNTSTSNCGSCGYTCPSGDSCVSGICKSACGTLTSCADGCRNLQTSTTDCGACGNSCSSGQTCSAGFCSTPTSTCSSCESSANSGTCASYYTACSADPNCGNYTNCMSACSPGDTVCSSSCQTSYASGVTLARNHRSCICTSACPTSCASAAYCSQSL